MNTFVDVTGYQSAVKGYSEYKAGTTNNTGTTVGGSFLWDWQSARCLWSYGNCFMYRYSAYGCGSIWRK
jgi:hypothetical protein